MSLQVWLPLNGSLENYGLNPIIPNSSNLTVNTNGKIGTCYTFNGSSYIAFPQVILPSQTPNWSFSCWFYLANTTTTTAQCLFSERTGTVSTGYSIFIYSNNSKILVDDGVRWEVTPMTFSASTWYHLTITRSPNGKKIYINGQLKNSTTTVGNTSTVNTNGCLFGYAQSSTALTTGGQGFNGRLNDIRLYNHCLSDKEVEELSKGLVLHYKLNQNTNSYFGWLKPNEEKTIVRQTSNTFADYTYYTDLISCSDTTYIVDFEAKGSVSGMSLDIYFRNSSGSAYAGTATQALTTTWQHYTLTINGSPSALQIFRIRCFSGTANDVISIRKVRLLSATMPVINNIIYDASGYKNNGTLYDSTYTIDTSRYDTGLNLVGTTVDSSSNTIVGAQYITGNLLLSTIGAITVAWWAKINNYGRGGIFETTAGDLITTNDYNTTAIANWDSTFRVYNGSSYVNFMSNFTINDSVWHHRCITFDGANVKYYQDGQLKQTGALTGTLPSIVGFRMGIGRAGGVYRQIDQQVSDLRIYITALTIDQIKELYNTSVTIDKNGNIYSREYVENSDLNITKTGLFQNNNIYDDNDLSIASILKDEKQIQGYTLYEY